MTFLPFHRISQNKLPDDMDYLELVSHLWVLHFYHLFSQCSNTVYLDCSKQLFSINTLSIKCFVSLHQGNVTCGQLKTEIAIFWFDRWQCFPFGLVKQYECCISWLIYSLPKSKMGKWVCIRGCPLCRDILLPTKISNLKISWCNSSVKRLFVHWNCFA